MEDKHRNKDSAVLGDFRAGHKGAGITSTGNGGGVFVFVHHRAVITFPAGFVLVLVQIVLVVADNMVEEPGVTGDARLKPQNDLKTAIEYGLVKGLEVLVVMVTAQQEQLTQVVEVVELEMIPLNLVEQVVLE